jgi:hypothetical protein
MERLFRIIVQRNYRVVQQPPTEKGLGPRGYERNEIIGAWWVPPSNRKIVFAFGPRDSIGTKNI